jgi:hypothetical protein
MSRISRRIMNVVVAVLASVGGPAVLAGDGAAPDLSLGSLYRLQGGRTKQTNSLWTENPVELRFGEGRTKVVIADFAGPGIITMIHFALPANMKLNRGLVLRAFWDGEQQPSIEAPLVDFFCDPAGVLERVDSVLVNKKRGWNCYFPMPFARAARLEVEYDGPRRAGATWDANPAYCYVMYHTVAQLPEDTGYFHAFWRQDTVLLGQKEYQVMDAQGRGQFIGWNVTVRGVAPNSGYPVDENVKFFVDGEAEPSIEWQGLEDSFGFSWGFPEQANSFPCTGYQPFYNGAAAYRFTLGDRISFDKSLRMTVGFGKSEVPFLEDTSKPGSELEFSSVAYWYQKEPHRPFPPLAAARDRRPSRVSVPADPNCALAINCGNTVDEDEFLKPGWDYELKRGYTYAGWKTSINHCWADPNSLEFEVRCPAGVAGTLRLFILDADNDGGGRKESISVGGKPVGEYQGFQTGRWVEVGVTAADTGGGRIPVVITNLNSKANAVVSIVTFNLKE